MRGSLKSQHRGFQIRWRPNFTITSIRALGTAGWQHSGLSALGQPSRGVRLQEIAARVHPGCSKRVLRVNQTQAEKNNSQLKPDPSWDGARQDCRFSLRQHPNEISKGKRCQSVSFGSRCFNFYSCKKQKKIFSLKYSRYFYLCTHWRWLLIFGGKINKNEIIKICTYFFKSSYKLQNSFNYSPWLNYLSAFLLVGTWFKNREMKGINAFAFKV